MTEREKTWEEVSDGINKEEPLETKPEAFFTEEYLEERKRQKKAEIEALEAKAVEFITRKHKAESIKATIATLECIEHGDMSRDSLLDLKMDIPTEITRLEAKLAELEPEEEKANTLSDVIRQSKERSRWYNRKFGW